jgi:hypothetical protein
MNKKLKKQDLLNQKNSEQYVKGRLKDFLKLSLKERRTTVMQENDNTGMQFLYW